MFEKMYSSRVLNQLDEFRFSKPEITPTRLARSYLDMFLLWQVITRFKPKSFLEIGFGAGQTMGIIYEASGRCKEYTSVDICYKNKNIFCKVFPEAVITFLEMNSKYLDFPQDKKFDFVHIDGDHSYDMACNDIDRCWHTLDQTSILYMDDIQLPGVDQAIRNHLLEKTDWVPFLCGDQSMFFHHRSQSKDQFLDVDISEKSKNFVYFLNEVIYDHVVLKARLPNVFVDYPNIFIETLKAYDL